MKMVYIGMERESSEAYAELGRVLWFMMDRCTEILSSTPRGVYLQCSEIPEEVEDITKKFVEVREVGEEE
ncbi:hypothetical protein IC007_1829 [Sulfuracidifex tepidarius]|uniref:Uncharacterized protein n=2 Tax=Sulfuracidifex tepidarius TaxID=1294262 RepID=A0A510E447_9CREN|nr:hypothetical protein IC007_1829 [Sulfuracidifex tepidarius]